ncbi:hypothetical protein [Neisseria canis]|uniref:Uncharacterized protein n=1 Tax=Neisseria canis TaxID=493 RepID=A0A448D9K1_9NEIS|nr:hypothetical protein [Neisseria canis]OSI12974.1 hypothetical protein BWD07_02570 [Neisseria canis]VEF02430.1 Uncharacterised protein [Neisseria canis]
MKHYIIWFSDEYERAEEAADLARKLFLPWQAHESALEALVRFMQKNGHPSDCINRIEPISEFIHNINHLEVGPSRCYNSYVGFFAHCEPLDSQLHGVLQDIAYLLRNVPIGNSEDFVNMISDVLSDADILWLFSRYRCLIIDWQSNNGLTINDFGYCVEDVMEGSVAAAGLRREVVCRWVRAVYF